VDLLKLAYDIARREVDVPEGTADFIDDFILDDAARTKSSFFKDMPTVSPGWSGNFTSTDESATCSTMSPDTPTPPARKDYFFAVESPVSSSNVAEVGYNNGKLIVYFNNGWGYTYDVDPDLYDRMMAASSKGSFVWDELRGRRPGHVIDMPTGSPYYRNVCPVCGGQMNVEVDETGDRRIAVLSCIRYCMNCGYEKRAAFEMSNVPEYCPRCADLMLFV
jgi:hypothetical protein